MDSSPDRTFDVAHKADTSLENFLARPVLIKQYNWSTTDSGGYIGSTAADRIFNPWELFFTDARVKEKIDYFNLCRCKLHLKFVINGNPFYYGRAMVSYTPLATYDDDFSQEHTNSTSVGKYAVPYSQRQKIFLDPSTSQGAEMVLPFVWWSNAMRLTNADWEDMGEISVFTLDALKFANNGTSKDLTIQVFAWAEEVTLSVPTSHDAQMGMSDEYKKDGIISSAMHAVAHVAGKLVDVPLFAPYAMATQTIASAIGSVAKLFGFSRPAILEDIKPYAPRVLGNLSNTSGGELVSKLTLDPKQETTIDSRAVGLSGADEMVIANIAQKESYLTSFAWEQAAPSGFLLFNSEVSPVLWEGTITGGLALPACAFAALPFRYWRGTMNFRFVVVASGYHKGRLRIAYDPVNFSGATDFNTTYNTIIDLDETRDFTVPIGWGSQFGMLQHRNPTLGDSEPYDTLALSSPSVRGNGILRVEVLNELTSPGDASADHDINILVFVSAGEDFEVFEPDITALETFSYFPAAAPQLGIMDAHMGMSETTEEENKPHDACTTDAMASSLAIDHTHHVYFGDPVVSFRQCLKRYNLHENIRLGSGSNGFKQVELRRCDFPEYRGRDPAGIHTTGETPADSYNYVKQTLLNYVTPAYVTRRGALRWKMHLMNANSSSNQSSLVLSRWNRSGTVTRANNNRDPPTGGDSVSNYAFSMSEEDRWSHSWGGTAATPGDVNPVLEVEFPWYSYFRFAPARNKDMSSNSGVNFGNYFHRLDGLLEFNSGTPSGVITYVAAGEDFNLAGFIGAPIAYGIEDPTPA
jgi:hypothetical protein